MRSFLLFLILIVIVAVVGFFLWDQYGNGDDAPIQNQLETENGNTGNGGENGGDNGGGSGNGGTDSGENGGTGNDNGSSNGGDNNGIDRDGSGSSDGLDDSDTPGNDREYGDGTTLPSTALISDTVDRILLGLGVIFLAVALYKTNIIGRLFFPLPDYIKADFYGVGENDNKANYKLQKKLAKINKNILNKMQKK